MGCLEYNRQASMGRGYRIQDGIVTGEYFETLENWNSPYIQIASLRYLFYMVEIIFRKHCKVSKVIPVQAVGVYRVWGDVEDPKFSSEAAHRRQ